MRLGISHFSIDMFIVIYILILYLIILFQGNTCSGSFLNEIFCKSHSSILNWIIHVFSRIPMQNSNAFCISFQLIFNSEMISLIFILVTKIYIEITNYVFMILGKCRKSRDAILANFQTTATPLEVTIRIQTPLNHHTYVLHVNIPLK